MSEQERYEALAMAAVDGVLTADEEEELDALVADDPERAAELADFRALKTNTDAMRDRIAASAQIEPIRPGAVAKSGLNLGFVLVWVGLLGLYGFGGYKFMVNPEIHVVAKSAGGLLGAGMLILFFSALRTRLRGLKHDPYQEIDR